MMSTPTKKGRIVVITGAGGGLGKALAQSHLMAGDTVYGLEAFLMDGIKELMDQSPKMNGFHCDIRQEESVREGIAQFIQYIPQVDLLYNVAGICFNQAKVGLTETDIELCKEMMDVNAYGMIRVTKELWHHLVPGTVILNISSEAGSIHAARRTSWYGYCMSKAAMNMASKLLSNELWKRGVRVICIEPGWLKTQMGGQEAMESEYSITPELSASHILSIVNDIDQIPPDQMYMTYQGNVLPW